MVDQSMSIDEALAILKFRSDGHGRFLGPDECSYESLADVLQSGVLKFCGSGAMYRNIEFVASFVRLMVDYHDAPEDGPMRFPNPQSDAYYAARRKLCGDNETLEDFVLYSLDFAGLIEHGTSITGSWTTESGRAFLVCAEHWKNIKEN